MSSSIEQTYNSAKQAEILTQYCQQLNREICWQTLKALVLPAFDALLSAALIYTGVTRKYAFLKYAGIVGIVASGYFGYRQTRGIEERVKGPVRNLLGTYIDTHANVMRAIILDPALTDAKIVEKLTRYLKQEKALEIVNSNHSDISSLLDECLHIRDLQSLRQQIQELRQWTQNPILDWNICLKQNKLAGENFRYFEKGALVGIREEAVKGNANAVQLLENIAQYQSQQKWGEFKTQKEDNAYFQLGMVYLSLEGGSERASEQLMSAITETGFEKYQDILEIPVSNPMEKQEADIWRKKILYKAAYQLRDKKKTTDAGKCMLAADRQDILNPDECKAMADILAEAAIYGQYGYHIDLFEKAIEFYEKSLTLNPELIKDCAFTLAKCYDERAKNYGGAHKLPYYQNYIKTCERYFKYVPDPFIIKFDEDEAYDQRRFEDLNLRDGHSKISKEIETL